MKISVTPRSDQWNADDFHGGPRTFTIAGVKHGAAEQKYDVELVEGEGRVWRPPNGMLSVLVQLWGDDAAQWQGRRVTLFKDPAVRFGKEVPGGIRISHMSDIGPKAASPKITVSRGRKAPYPVQPLTDAAPSAPSTEIPQQVRDTVAGIPTREETLSYHDYLKAEGAPLFVLNYVAIQAEQKEPLA